MDILAIMFFIFGCIFKEKGLVIASLILSVFVITVSALFDKRISEDSVRAICFVCNFIWLGLAIIKLCIW